MKVVELLAQRRASWEELDRLCVSLQGRRGRRISPALATRFSDLYRAACADLALADAYQLPPNTVQFLHRLVGRAHNQLYRSEPFALNRWKDVLLIDAPQYIFSDRCVQLAFVIFWGIFILSALLANSETFFPGYAEAMIGEQMLNQLKGSFAEPPRGRSMNMNMLMAAYYISHNTGIGLKCFAGGLAIVPGIYLTLYNAAALGAAFGYMARDSVKQGDNFFEFVTAHGPFELTAIVLAAGAGLRLGVSLISTRGWARSDSLRITAKDAMPIMGASMILFFLAALTEAFISPSALPYAVKAAVGLIDSLLLLFYFVGLGFPRGKKHAF
ncbi:MAG: stage II sporulation protein M [Planctomycetota bacterium]